MNTVDTKALSKVLICGERCVGKTTLMWGLQKELGWPVYSASQFLRDYIRQYGLRGDPSKIQNHHERMSAEIDQRIKKLLESEYQVIIEARAFRYIKESFAKGLKVLLTADPVIKYKRSSQREATEYARAAQRIEKKDKEFRVNTGKIFGFYDMFEPKYYDVVMDTSLLSKEAVVQAVVERLR